MTVDVLVFASTATSEQNVSLATCNLAIRASVWYIADEEYLTKHTFSGKKTL